MFETIEEELRAVIEAQGRLAQFSIQVQIDLDKAQGMESIMVDPIAAVKARAQLHALQLEISPVLLALQNQATSLRKTVSNRRVLDERNAARAARPPERNMRDPSI